MTEQDIVQVLHILRVNYPNPYTKFTEADEAEMLNLWKIMLSNDDVRDIKSAVMWIINNDTREFAPNIGQIRNVAAQLKIKNHNAQNNITAEGDWDEAYKLLQKIDWNVTQDKELYNKLPQRTKDILSFHEWYAMASDSRSNNLQYKKPQFLKAWNKSIDNQAVALLESNHKGAYEKLGSNPQDQLLLNNEGNNNNG